MKTFDEYSTEALRFSDYPRAGDDKTNKRVADQLNGMFYDDVPVLPGSATVRGVELAVLGAVPQSAQSLPVYPAMAMCGEAGEFAEKVKKAWRDQTPLDREGAAKELGDVLWYVAAAARDLGYSLEDVARMNIEKFVGRRQRGTLAGAGDNR